MMETSNLASLSKRSICLTMDIEPDYGRCSSTHILEAAAPFFTWISAEAVPITAFVTGRLIESKHPIVDQLLTAGVRLELHGYAHQASGFGTAFTSHAEEIQRGTEAYVNRFGHVPAGYRAPAGIISADDLRLLAALGYRYDSSIFPVQRRGRYHFSELPRHPFVWQEAGLDEFPVGLLAPGVPSGLTFINLFGSLLSARLITRAARKEFGPHIIDGHLHNLFSHPEARSTLPWALRQLYTLGTWAGGLDGLRAMTQRLRRAGFIFTSLHEHAMHNGQGNRPSVALAALKKEFSNRS